jgi:hypothetical protein
MQCDSLNDEEIRPIWIGVLRAPGSEFPPKGINACDEWADAIRILCATIRPSYSTCVTIAA